MAYTSHTPDDVGAMLEAIGVETVADLFSDLPDELRFDGRLSLPDGLSELELAEWFDERAARNVDASRRLSFVGHGAYDHYVPAVVQAITSRSEYATAYTPYQPEVSQGTLQAIFEFQTAISELAGLPVANASLYDGATATAEAMYLAQQVGGGTRVLVSSTVNANVRQVLQTYAWAYDLTLEEVPPGADGRTDAAALEELLAADVACVVLQHPNALGLLEDAPAMCSAIAAAGSIPVVHADPLSLGVLEAPGSYGAGIVVGSGQPLGCGLHFGGPAFGFFAADRRFIRRMPGRIVGQSRDARGARAYTLTLQTREQHIRREKATSNICTNQALNALAGIVYLGWLGPAGLQELGAGLLDRAALLAQQVGQVDGFEVAFDGPWFREVPIRCPRDPRELVDRCREQGIDPGVWIGDGSYPGVGDDVLLVAVTERHSRADIERLAAALEEAAS